MRCQTVGKGRVLCTVFQPQQGHARLDLEPRPLPHQQIKKPQSLAGLITLYRNVFACFRLKAALLFCLKCVIQVSLSFNGRGQGPFLCGTRGAGLGGSPCTGWLATEAQGPATADAALSPLCEQSAVPSSVGCIVFSLATLTPRCSGRGVWSPPLGW